MAESEPEAEAQPPETAYVDLVWLLRMSHEQYLERFRDTAVRRAKRWMLQRNAAVALGNVGGPESLPALIEAMRSNENSIVRGHAAWAIGRLAERLGLHDDAHSALAAALPREHDETVCDEIEQALETSRKSKVESRK